MNDFEKRMRRSRKLAEIAEIITFILFLVISFGSVALSIFVYNGLFASDLPEWMKWAFLIFG